MRALHLSFWLHHPYELHESSKWAEKSYYGGEAAFREADQAEYQPLLALLERNSQRYPKMHVTLAISGVWLEQAERWDAELIKRVRKLVEKGTVSLAVVPYYYAMAAFYDLDELKSQVTQMQDKLEQTFSVRSQVLALPRLCYHNRLAKWAEKLDFQAILAGDARRGLGWRSVNHVYEAKGCEKLKVLLEDAKLISMVEQASPLVMERVTEEGKERTMFAAKIFQKQLDLALLRGDLVNLYFDSKIFAKWRDMGIIGFFDEVIKKWAETPGMQLVDATDLLEIEPFAEISLKKTVSGGDKILDGDVSEKDYQLPSWWTASEDKNSHDLYNLRKNIVAVRDRDLYVDFARLTAMEYAKGGKEFTEIIADLQKRLLKLLQDEDVQEKRAEGGMMASTAVQVKFDHKARESRRRRETLIQLYREANSGEEGVVWDNEAEMDDAEAALQVLAQRLKQSQEAEQDNYDDAAEAEVVADDIWMETEVAEEEMMEEPIIEPEPEEKPKVHKKRKKIVIE